jgi:tripartite-type tricarboxylate transporter receptor subunit TctC
MDRREFLKLTATASVLSITTTSVAFAQWKPRRPINIILPYKAGGGTDSFARAVAAVSDQVLSVPVVVVNKPGSSGITGATQAAGARPDGTTFMITSAGSFLLTSMLRETDVNPFDSFKIVAQIGNLSTSLMVPANSPYQSIDDLVADAKARPGALRWAHTGRGGFHHIAGQGFLNANGLDAVDVPFKGGSATRAAVIGGQVDFAFIGVQQSAGFENELRVLALNAPERDRIMSDVPTFAELGYEFVDVSSPILVFAPNGVDEEAIAGMQSAIEQITTLPEFAEIMAKRGNAPVYLNGADATARLLAMKDAAEPIIASLK